MAAQALGSAGWDQRHQQGRAWPGIDPLLLVLRCPPPPDYFTCRTELPGQTVSFLAAFPPSAG